MTPEADGGVVLAPPERVPVSADTTGVGRGSEQRLEVTADTSQAEQRVTGVQRYLQDLRTVSAKPNLIIAGARSL